VSLKNNIERDGYVLVRNLLLPEEIEILRDSLLAHFSEKFAYEGLGKHQANAAMHIPDISWLFSQTEIIDTFKELLGSDKIIFTSNVDAHMNMLSWWHKDISEGRGCFKGDYFNYEDFRIYRVGIYLQDQPRHGFSLRLGSHRSISLTSGEVEYVSTLSGDVIFFDIRLTHAGQFADPIEYVMCRVARFFKCEPFMYGLKNIYQKIRLKPEKLSIFFTVGYPNQHTQDFCDFVKERCQNNWGQK
jgi:hypothetical protein